MLSIIRRDSALVGLCLAAAIAGCSGRDLPETIPVTGQVTYQGKPLVDAQIGFIPKQEGSGAHPARGRTDERGAFELTTYFGPQDELSGATPGDYIVTVQKHDVPGDPVEVQKMFFKNPGMVPKSLLPAEYGDPGKSELTATVVEDGDNSFEFKLE